MSWKDTVSVSLEAAPTWKVTAPLAPAEPSSRLMPLNCTELR